MACPEEPDETTVLSRSVDGGEEDRFFLLFFQLNMASEWRQAALAMSLSQGGGGLAAFASLRVFSLGVSVPSW